MKQSSQKLQPATFFVAAEYRTGRLDAIVLPAKGNMPERNFVRAIHAVEVGDRALELSEMMPAETDLAGWSAPMPKGAKVSLGLFIEPASCLSVGVDGKAKESKGLWRIRVVSISAQPAGGK